MTRVGYARVSTSDKGQSVDPQILKLKAAGCEVVFSDTGESGKKASRPQWDLCLASLNPGDTLYAVRLDRFGRSLQHLLKLADDLNSRSIGLVCTDQAGIDSTSSMGRLLFSILGAVAEFEAAITRERVLDGLAVAVANGKTLGAPKAIDDKTLSAAITMKAAGMPVVQICDVLKVRQSTLYRAMAAAGT